MFDAAIDQLLDNHPSVQTCSWDGHSFRALVGEAVAPTAPEARGADEDEIELVLTCRDSDFDDWGNPDPGDEITVGSSVYPVIRVHEVPGNGELEIVVRDAT